MAAVVARILGSCFYYAPGKEPVRSLIGTLPELSELFCWQQPEEIRQHCLPLCTIAPQQLEYDFSVLFEGQGVMPAPPWGSVYRQQDNLLLGQSTLHYRAFLAAEGIALQQNEPEDQFGLMLLALAKLLESSRLEAASLLLSEHLLPWATRYLDLVQKAELEQPFYPVLATVAADYLHTLSRNWQVSVADVELYF